MQISDLKFWKDSGFAENTIEVPAFGSGLPTPDLTVDTTARSKDWSRYIDLGGVTYLELLDTTYMSFNMTTASSGSCLFYGWVDKVEMLSDSTTVSTRIHWHPDLWRMWGDKCVFGSGMVTRRPLKGTYPPQPYPYITRLFDTSKVDNLSAPYFEVEGEGFVDGTPTIVTRYSVFWVYIAYTSEDSQGHVTTNSWMCIPVDTTNGPEAVYISQRYSGGGLVPGVACVRLSAFEDGSWDEDLGLDPARITGIWATDIPPAYCYGKGTSANPFRLYYRMCKPSSNPAADWYPYAVPIIEGNKTNAYFAVRPSQLPPLVNRFNPNVTDDTHEVIILTNTGTTMATIPYKFGIHTVNFYTILTESGPYVRVVLDEASYDYGGTSTHDIWRAQVQGLMFNYPMTALPLSSNSWSSYVYSGGRDIIVDNLKLQADDAKKRGQIGAMTSAVSGGMSGALSGVAAGGPIGMAVGAIAGAATSAATGLISTQMTYNWQSGEYADRMVDIDSRSHAMQADAMVMPGEGMAIFTQSAGMVAVQVHHDDYSQGVRDSDLKLYGVHVQEATPNCTALIYAGGPLRIQNLVVRGPVPAEARAYIKQRLSNGVIIK